MNDTSRRILLTGATGYVGGRLLRRLEESGFSVRCMARRPDRLRARVSPRTEVVAGDVLNAATLAPALNGIDTAFYLIHSMGDAGDFMTMEQEAAHNFAEAAREAGVRRIVYLGGLGDDELSPHLASRHRVGDIFRDSAVPTIEFRSSAIIGSGSASFEMVRALVNHLPVMITPRWVRKRTQPIAIEDVLEYLLAAVGVDLEGSRAFEIGAPDIVSYEELMLEYARQQGLRRLLIRVPVLTPRLSSLWLGLVTPLYARVGRKLIDSIRNETIVKDESVGDVFPEIEPRSVRAAIARAMVNEDQEFAETRWSDALSSRGMTFSQSAAGYGGERLGGRLVDRRSVALDLPPAAAFAPVERIGGERGWYFGNFLWSLRGYLDLLVGGVGMRRGRRHPTILRTGDALDWWRVESIEPGRLLRLAAEMKVPGRAWLQFEVEPDGDGSVLYQTALFDPKGLPGLLYWYGIYPVHALVFRGMIRGIALEARRLELERDGLPPTRPWLRCENRVAWSTRFAALLVKGGHMKLRRIEPRVGQESVWDYPRPPAAELTDRSIEIWFAGQRLAASHRAVRVLETSHPPVYYLPPHDVRMELLRPGSGTSYCEWKGRARYFDVQVDRRSVLHAAWAYPDPGPAFQALRDHLAFYPSKMDRCLVDGEEVEAQAGDFYGGWITSDIVGPFKGEPGSGGW